ncbi:MAG: hypothetical protein WCQ77_09845 [Planctomycetota bacterium]
MRSEIDEQNSFTLAAKEIALGLLARYSYRCNQVFSSLSVDRLLSAIPGRAGYVAARGTAIAGANLALADAGVTAATTIALRAASG